MALARVVSFDGVSKSRMDEMKREMNEGGPPEGSRRQRSSSSTNRTPKSRW
jgi:hypothetical protein